VLGSIRTSGDHHRQQITAGAVMRARAAGDHKPGRRPSAVLGRRSPGHRPEPGDARKGGDHRQQITGERVQGGPGPCWGIPPPGGPPWPCWGAETIRRGGADQGRRSGRPSAIRAP
jgi:hypothetical protein